MQYDLQQSLYRDHHIYQSRDYYYFMNDSYYYFLNLR
jgi:hypothetical protein